MSSKEKPVQGEAVAWRVRPHDTDLSAARVINDARLAESMAAHRWLVEPLTELPTPAESQPQGGGELKRLREAMRKIADWHGAYGPFPETNNEWRAMVVVTAREALSQDAALSTPAVQSEVSPASTSPTIAAPGDVEERARELLDAECIKRAPRSSALVSVSTALRAISAALRSQEPAYGPDGSMSIHCQQDGCQMYKHPPECWSQGQAVAVDDAMRRELKRDAERYRWLRDESGNDIAAPFVCGVHGAPMGDAGWLTGDLLDAAIDAAMNGANT